MQRFLITVSLVLAINGACCGQSRDQGPLRLGVAGLVHDHVHAVLRRHARGDVVIVGIAEPNRALAERYAKRYGFSMDLVVDSLPEVLDASKPEVVCDYGSIHGHLGTVECCAPNGIHVMVEKPLAVNLEHARAMQRLAVKHKTHLLTNYETTWYGSHHRTKQLLATEPTFGDIRKIVVHDGHPGPAEIGCSEEFLAWLTDPRLNGAGALTDFGCYGANLSTWLMNGARPDTVTAVTQQIKPDRYPNVDDEATIIMTYPKAQAILQASWNWNFNRKDIEVYCQRGYVHCLDNENMKIMRSQQEGVIDAKANPLGSPLGDPFEYLAAVVRGAIHVSPTDLSSLQNNLIVVEILEAAKISAREARTVRMAELNRK